MLQNIFKAKKPIIGMVSLGSLPGCRSCLGYDMVLKHALVDAEALVGGGVDGLMIENSGDTPFYPENVPPHVVSFMSIILWEIKKKHDLPVGVNVLRNDVRSAIGIASATGAEYLRANVHVGCVATDQGLIQGKAYRTIRYRSVLNSDVAILADVRVKHGKALYDAPLAQLARDTFHRGMADALIVTGPEVGVEAKLDDLIEVKKAAPQAPVLVGSGVTPMNIKKFLEHSDGAIVGTFLKKDGNISNPVDADRVRMLMRAAREA